MAYKYLAGTLVKREYKNLRGVDFSSDDTQMDLSRSPYAVNVWKDYNSELGQAIETRAGFRILKHFPAYADENYTAEDETEILALYGFTFDADKFFVAHIKQWNGSAHVGKLVRWTNYPTEPCVFEEILDKNGNGTVIGTTKSSGFPFNEVFYIIDGTHYIGLERYNGTIVSYSVSDNAFVPTTYLVAKDGTAEKYNDFNALSGKMKNQFTIKATSDRDYILRPRFPDKAVTIESVTADGDAIPSTAYSLDGYKVTFTGGASLTENGILVIEFSQDTGTINQMLCDKACVFDNRVFFANCSAERTAFYWSALNDPEYFPDINFDYAGSEDVEITALINMGDNMAIVKKESGVYAVSGIATGDDLMPKAYASMMIASSIGGYGGGINFLNDPIFVSKQGVKAITRLDLHNERNIAHRSTLIDGKLRNEANLDSAIMRQYRGYCFILVNGRCYLADSRQTFKNVDAEYEWYFWDNIGVYEKKTGETDSVFFSATDMLPYNDMLYFGTSNGCICAFNFDVVKDKSSGELRSSAYADESIEDGDIVPILIPSCWTTPMDDFTYRNHFKRCNKKGALADLKSFTHSTCKVGLKTNGVAYNDLKRHNGGYFDFADLDFSDFTFNTSDKNTFFFQPKDKKWERLSLRFYSDEPYKPFGVFGVTIEAYVMGYAKERS